jgi:hypothetical protein
VAVRERGAELPDEMKRSRSTGSTPHADAGRDDRRVTKQIASGWCPATSDVTLAKLGYTPSSVPGSSRTASSTRRRSSKPS